MRSLRAVALVMGLALVPLPLAHAALAAAASSLFEALPFLLAGQVSRAGGRHRWLVALLGCGCAGGPAARSLPAALLGAALLGPWIAAVRFAAAWTLRSARPSHAHGPADPLAALEAYLPYALAGGAAVTIVPALAPELGSVAWPLAALAGALLAFVSAPCAFGAITLGSALGHIQPALGYGWLAVAGVADLRVFGSRPQHAPAALGKAAAAALVIALGVVVLRHGATLIHPRFVPLLALAGGSLAWSWRGRPPTRRGLGLAAFLLAAALFVRAPDRPPLASATTLSSAYAGEPFAMRGQVARAGAATFVTRQAITCCRADAVPVTIRTAREVARPSGAWVAVRGVLVLANGTLCLRVRALRDIAPPADPYLYR